MKEQRAENGGCRIAAIALVEFRPLGAHPELQYYCISGVKRRTLQPYSTTTTTLKVHVRPLQIFGVPRKPPSHFKLKLDILFY
jgi:hypothetical protein